eukprot:PhF_6_TR18677/c0_g1_i1/m.27300/K02895/RP-L24, MRPL24, rplX; large subunit ribosomal protein L24
MKSSRILQTNVANYRFRNPWYYNRRRSSIAQGVHPNVLRNLNIDRKFTRMYYDHKHDLSSRDNLQESEDLRHPKELDHYQDHTYHTQWEARDHSKQQQKEIAKSYKWMSPGYQVEPWVWYRGDEVEVMTGPERGKRGVIRSVIKYKNEIVVEGVNVKKEEFPATEDRPKQIVYNPFPISVKNVLHVDKSNGQVCEMRLIKVRDKADPTKEKIVRVSLATGSVLDIPIEPTPPTVGDPLLDTSIHDALENTNVMNDIDTLAQMKLEALESHFVGELKKAYEFNKPLQDEVAGDYEKFKWDVWIRAKAMLQKKLDMEGKQNDSSDVTELESGTVPPSQEPKKKRKLKRRQKA